MPAAGRASSRLQPGTRPRPPARPPPCPALPGSPAAARPYLDTWMAAGLGPAAPGSDMAAPAPHPQRRCGTAALGHATPRRAPGTPRRAIGGAPPRGEERRGRGEPGRRAAPTLPAESCDPTETGVPPPRPGVPCQRGDSWGASVFGSARATPPPPRPRSRRRRLSPVVTQLPWAPRDFESGGGDSPEQAVTARNGAHVGSGEGSGSRPGDAGCREPRHSRPRRT